MKIKRGQIWYIDNSKIKNNEDHTQAGIRPWVILSNDRANKHSPFISAIPLTCAEKKPLPTHCQVGVGENNCIALCEQVQLINKYKLVRYVSDINPNELQDVESCIMIQLGLASLPEIYM